MNFEFHSSLNIEIKDLALERILEPFTVDGTIRKHFDIFKLFLGVQKMKVDVTENAKIS